MKTPSQFRNMEYAAVLVEIAKLFRPKVYMELGIKKGYTLLQMAPWCGKVIGVDVHRTALNINNAEFHWMTTMDYLHELRIFKAEEFIDMLFIDALHQRDAVLKDLLGFLPYVRTGTGIIFLHDTHPVNENLLAEGYCWNAWEAADSLFKTHLTSLEIVTLPGPWAGLSILRKRGSHHLAWKKEMETDNDGTGKDVSPEVLRETDKFDMESGYILSRSTGNSGTEISD